MNKVFAAAYALLWLVTLVLVMSWDKNAFSIVATALGLSASLMAIFGLGWWRPVGALGSLVFLGNWGRAFVLMGAGGTPFDTYASVLGGATRGGGALDAAVVIGYEAALPLVHSISLIGLIVAMVRKRSDR